MVNCNSSPDHRCCKYAEEDEDKPEEEVAAEKQEEQPAVEQVLIKQCLLNL